MKARKEILTNLDGIAIMLLYVAFVVNLAVLVINIFRYYVLDAGSWRLIEESFILAVFFVVLLVALHVVISPLYGKVVKAVTDPVVNRIEYGVVRREARRALAEGFRCSDDEARVIDKFWEQMSIDLARLGNPSVCTSEKIFEETEKAHEWQKEVNAYNSKDPFDRDPRKSLKLRMFKHTASIDLMISKIVDYSSSTSSIRTVTKEGVLATYKSYLEDDILLETRNKQKAAPPSDVLSKRQAKIMAEYDRELDTNHGNRAAYDRLKKGMEHYLKIKENPNAQSLIDFYKD